MPTFISREAILKQKVEKKVKDKGNKKSRIWSPKSKKSLQI